MSNNRFNLLTPAEPCPLGTTFKRSFRPADTTLFPVQLALAAKIEVIIDGTCNFQRVQVNPFTAIVQIWTDDHAPVLHHQGTRHRHHKIDVHFTVTFCHRFGSSRTRHFGQFTSGQFIIAGYGVPSPGLPYIALKHFENEPFVGLKSIQKFNDMAASLCAAAGFEPHVVYETLNWDTVSMLVASGMGSGFVPDVLLNHFTGERSPQYYHLLGLDALRPYAVACKRGTTLSPLARQLVEIFRSNIQRAETDIQDA